MNHTFLNDNAQSHTSAMSAFGDAFDNARESGAKTLHIRVIARKSRSSKEVQALVISDNGRALTATP